MTRYIGVLEGADDNWGVWFPDVMGCVGAGATADEAIQNATTALTDVSELMVADGEELPAARGTADIMKDEWVAEALAKGDVLVAIPLVFESGKSTRANISLDTGLLQAIDAAAKRAGLTRSAFLASAAREKILSSV